MKRLVAVAQLALCFVFVFCNSDRPPELVGQWELALAVSGDWTEETELLKDGTGVDGGTDITWKVDGGRLFIFRFGLNAEEMYYKVSGYELSLAYDGGNSAIYVRKGKLEEFKAKRVAATEAEKAKRIENAKKGMVELPLDPDKFPFGADVQRVRQAYGLKTLGCANRVWSTIEDEAMCETFATIENGGLRISFEFENSKLFGVRVVDEMSDSVHYEATRKILDTLRKKVNQVCNNRLVEYEGGSSFDGIGVSWERYTWNYNRNLYIGLSIDSEEEMDGTIIEENITLSYYVEKKNVTGYDSIKWGASVDDVKRVLPNVSTRFGFQEDERRVLPTPELKDVTDSINTPIGVRKFRQDVEYMRNVLDTESRIFYFYNDKLYATERQDVGNSIYCDPDVAAKINVPQWCKIN
jgi:hypothetical protein